MNGWARSTYPEIPWKEYDLGLLVSYFYLSHYRPEFGRDCPRLMLDSGAFSAWKSGATIDMPALVAEARRPCWREVVTLDVIGNPDASHRNALAMRQSVGAHVMPVFHYGEPIDLLARYCEAFDYVGLSCRFGESYPESMRWLARCFAKHYPHRFHSFGCMYFPALRELPFYSADSVTWAMSPPTFGRWETMGRLRTRKKVTLLAQVKHLADRQAFLRSLWKDERARWN